MKFEVIAKEIKTRELIAAQTDMEATLEIMSRFLLDENGERMTPEAGRDILLDTDLEEFITAQEDFLAAFNLRKKNGRP